MKHLHFLSGLILFFFLGSCSSNEVEESPVIMQPSSFSTNDATGSNQTFEYDAKGRIVGWNLTSNSAYDQTSYTARYDYPDTNTIKVTSEESRNEQKRCFDETIKLVNGRALSSEGSLIFYIDDHLELIKTYRHEFTYDPSNHLNTVKHSEVVGSEDDIKNDVWDKAWTWENYLIWENGNLIEYQDYQGHSSLYQTTKFGYSALSVEYPVIIPMVINSAHHLPLLMQGVFGANSANLIESSAVFDQNNNLSISYQYTYIFESGRIIEFSEAAFGSSHISNQIDYKVNWTEKYVRS